MQSQYNTNFVSPNSCFGQNDSTNDYIMSYNSTFSTVSPVSYSGYQGFNYYPSYDMNSYQSQFQTPASPIYQNYSFNSNRQNYYTYNNQVNSTQFEVNPFKYQTNDYSNNSSGYYNNSYYYDSGYQSISKTESPIFSSPSINFQNQSASKDSSNQLNDLISKQSTPIKATKSNSTKDKKRKRDEPELTETKSILNQQPSNDIAKRPKILKMNFTAASLNPSIQTDTSADISSKKTTLFDPLNQYKCSLCANTYNSAAKLLMHQHKSHKNGSSTQCPICYKKFGNQANTMVHLRAHTQEKTYTCQYCDNAFCDSSTLKKHLRTHTGEKPYECQLCQKKFTQSGNLKRHILVHQKYDLICNDENSIVPKTIVPNVQSNSEIDQCILNCYPIDNVNTNIFNSCF